MRETNHLYGLNRIIYTRKNGQEVLELGGDFNRPKDVIDYVNGLNLHSHSDIEVCEFLENGDILTIYDYEDFEVIFDI